MPLPLSPCDTPQPFNSPMTKIAPDMVSPAASPCGIDNPVIRHPGMDGLVFLNVECLDIIYLHDTNEVLANASAPLSTYLVRHDPVYLNQRDDGSLLVKQVVHPDAFLLQSELRDGTGKYI